jgi:GDSL-like lipase/acylhydrolase family protein
MKIKIVLQNILLMVIAVAIVLAIGELAIRWIKPVYDYRDRSLLFSSPTFMLYTGGSVRYYPHEKIREVAVYNDKIEYDVLYNTNNLGFVDSKNYGHESISGKSYYALVGDSFTAGVNGGSPWVPKLRNNKAHAEVYNFGIAATGFEHFYRLLHDMKDKVKITHIIIVAITDDFFRGYWHPLVTDGDISFCSENGTHSRCQPVPVASIIPINAPEGEIREISRNKYREIRAKVDEINAANSLLTKIESVLYDDSAIFYYAKVLLDTYRRSHQPSNIEDAIESMRKIRNEFPLAEIHLIHLPQKYEVMTKNYHINIADQISELGVKYYPALEKCNWSIDMFFPRDGHPNSYGYENITRCVSAYLFDSKNGLGADTPKR